MQNWRNAIHARLTRMIAPRRIDHATPLAELRKIHEGMFAGFGPTPHDVKAENAQLGQIKGEWIRVSESHPNRLVLYLHGGGFIAGSPESHRSLIANLCKVSGAAALAVDVTLIVPDGPDRKKADWDYTHEPWQRLVKAIRAHPRLHSLANIGDWDHIEAVQWRKIAAGPVPPTHA